MDRLHTLLDQIRTAWDTNRDIAVAYRLADEHQDLADDLRRYASVLVDMEFDVCDEPLGHDVFAASASSWLDERFPSDPSASLAGGSGHSTRATSRRPLLRLVTECTGKKATEAAREMGVTPQFISAASRHASALPRRWGIELARRAYDAFGIPHAEAEEAYLHGLDAGRLAASRSGTFGPAPTPNQVLDQGGISDPDDRALWLSLATDV